MTQHCIAVLGMHRSGTSALTRALNLCGVALPGRMMDNTEGNASGHWEPLEVVAIHDRLLADHDLAWDDVYVDVQEFTAASMQQARRAVVDFLQNSASSSTIAIKDPRMCYTLPLWQEALSEVDMHGMAIFATRHPLAVARSLHARNQMPIAYGLQLWLHHTLAAEYYSRNWQRMVVHYDALINDWRSVLDPVATWLGIPLPSTQPAVSAQLNAFLQPNQRHHSEDADTIQHLAQTHPDVLHAWNLCQQDLHATEVQAAFDTLRIRTQQCWTDSDSALHITLQYARQRYHRDMATRDAEIAWRIGVQAQQVQELAWRKQVMLDHKLEP